MTGVVHSIVGVPRPLALDRAYVQSRISDDTVAKVLAISEVAQIARTEQKLRAYLEAQWLSLQKEAVGASAAMAARGKSAASIAAKIDSVMARWAGNVEDVFTTELARIYKLGRSAAFKKAANRTKASLQYDTPNATEEASTQKAKREAKIDPKLDLADAGAVKALNKQQLFWIGEHYEKNVSKGIAEVTRGVIVEAGGDRVKAGRAMAEKVADQLSHVRTPDGFRGSSKQYFEGLVANAATVARAHSQMRSFLDIGITKYTIVNPLDERTCPVCQHMDGKVFSISDGAKQMGAELRAKNPAGVRAAHPWLGAGKIKKLTSASALAGAGQALPPFHFRCRCTVDISDEIGSWDDLEPMSPPTETEEAAPLPPELGTGSEAKVRAKMEKEILDSTLVSKKRLGGGVNSSEIATMEAADGTEIKGVWKTAEGEQASLRPNVKAGTYYQREAAVADLDTMLGDGAVVPPTVTRSIDGEIGSFQAFDPAARTLDDLRAGKDAIESLVRKGAADNETLRRTFLLDAISGNDDRHSGNLMFKFVTEGGESKVKAVAIDNGLTFPEGPAARFVFPLARGNKDAFFKLDDKSAEQVGQLDLLSFAKMLKGHGLKEKAIKPALVRAKALQMDRDFLHKLAGSRPEETVMREFIADSSRAPKKLLGATYAPKKTVEAALAEVDDVMAKVFK